MWIFAYNVLYCDCTVRIRVTTAMFVYAVSNPALRDVGCGLHARSVDGKEGSENRHLFFAFCFAEIPFLALFIRIIRFRRGRRF